MKLRSKILGVAALIAVAAPLSVQAHRMWMIPSATILSGTDNWVTIDAAVSNDLFYADHRPLQFEAKATAPDGSDVPVENRTVGAVRTTFDVHLKQQGTYRVAIVSDILFGTYQLNGETRSLPRSVTEATLQSVLPAGATNVLTAENSTRNEIFVTQGEPTANLFKPTGKGIELVPVTHPNDLVAGEGATFQFLLDGKPGANLPVTVVPGGKRYREELGEQRLTTDAQGKVTITWPYAGMYWVNVTTPRAGGGEGEGPGAGGPGAGASGGQQGPRRPAGPPQRRASYVTTVEVMTP